MKNRNSWNDKQNRSKIWKVKKEKMKLFLKFKLNLTWISFLHALPRLFLELP